MINRTEQLDSQQLFISFIVPVFNEAEIIAQFLQSLTEKANTLTKRFEIIIIDDGSHDDTINIIKQLALPTKLLCFSRNFGKEKAITAGLEHCHGDVAVIIDSDFQHPLDLVPEFLQGWAEGFNMVYGVRENRDNEGFIKRLFTKIFYRSMHAMTNVDIPANAGDFRLLDRKLINAINQCNERGRFMKGLYNWVGFKSKAITFTVPDRAGGSSSWKFRNLTGLALTGMTAFSNIPLRAWGLIGLMISVFSFACVIYIIAATLIHGNDVPGFATLLVTIVFFGGIQLLSIGILGEYIGRIFEEVKRRPQYIVAEKHGFESEPESCLDV